MCCYAPPVVNKHTVQWLRQTPSSQSVLVETKHTPHPQVSPESCKNLDVYQIHSLISRL